MTRLSKHLPQAYDDMVSELSKPRGSKSRFYKQESDEHRSVTLSAITERTREELAALPDRLRLTQDDSIDRIRQQTDLYFQACAASGALPSFLGLSRSLGYSSHALYRHMSLYPDSAISKFLEITRDAISDALDAAALSNSVNPIVSIFIQKSVHGRRESVELIASAPDTPLEGSGDIDAARAFADRLRLIDDAVNDEYSRSTGDA